MLDNSPDHKCGTESGNREYNIDAGLFYWDRGLERRSAEYAVITESGRVYVTEYEPIITSRHRLRLFVHNTKSFKTIPEYIINQTECDNQRILGEWKRASSGYVKPHTDYERDIILNQNIPNTGRHKRLSIFTWTSDSEDDRVLKTECRNAGSYGYSVKSTLYHVGEERKSKITFGFKSNNMKFYDTGNHLNPITEVELVDMAPDAMLNLHGTQQIASMDPVKSVVVLFFGPFYLTANNMILNSTTSFRKMIQKQEVHFNSRWIGCPEDFCYEFNIDAAYSVDDQEIILMSGMYDYSIDQWPPRRPPTLVEKRKWPKGGKYSGDESSFMVPVFAYRLNNTLIYGSRGYKYEGETKRMYLKTSGSGLKDIFLPELPNRYLLIAAVNINNEIFFFKDDPVNITLKNSSGEYIQRNVKGSDIDAAFSYNQSVVIITGNYYYNISMNDINAGNMFSGPFPIFSKEYLLKAGCSNRKYSNNSNFKKYLNVSSRSEFYYFVNRFIQVPSFRPEIPKRQTLTQTTSMTTEEPNLTSPLNPTPTTAETSSKGLLIILILLVVTAIFILAVMIALFRNKKEKS